MRTRKPSDHLYGFEVWTGYATVCYLGDGPGMVLGWHWILEDAKDFCNTQRQQMTGQYSVIRCEDSEQLY